MYRYWDGQAWSDALSPDPAAPPPGAAPPPAAPTQLPGQYAAQDQPHDPYQPQYAQQYAQQQPGQYGGGGYGSQDPYATAGGSGGGGGGGKRAALIALAVLLIAAIGVGGFVGVRALTDDDGDDQASDESSQGATDEPTESPTDATESPTESPSGSTTDEPTESPTATGPTGRECTGGQPTGGDAVGGDGTLQGGDLTLPGVRGFTPLEPQVLSVFTFADEVAGSYKQIDESWIAMYSLGALPRDNGYTDLEQSAEQVLTCMTGSPNFYRGFTGRKDLDNGPVQVDGYDAHQIVAEVRVDDPEVRVEGDIARVIVVDTGDAEDLGVFISVVPIGNRNLIGQQEGAVAGLTVDD